MQICLHALLFKDAYNILRILVSEDFPQLYMHTHAHLGLQYCRMACSRA